MAARRLVKQCLDTGTVREGVETLLLVGIDYPQLTAAQQQRLAAILRKRLADLDRLIQHIDWTQECQGLRVTRQEFADWVQADQLAEFPLAQVCDRPLTEDHLVEDSPVESPSPEQPGTAADSKERSQRWWQRPFLWASLLVVGLLGGMITVQGPAFLRQFLPAERLSQPLPCSAPMLASFTQALQALAITCQQPYEGVVSAVYRAAFPAKTFPADLNQQRQELCQDLRIWEIVVEQYYRSAKIKPYAFINNPSIIATLRDLFSDVPPDIEAILTVRRHLAELGTAFADLHTTLVKWGIDKLPPDGRFAEVIRYVRSLQCAACTHVEPIFPFLAPSDEEVVRVFHDLFLKEGVPLRDALPGADVCEAVWPREIATLGPACSHNLFPADSQRHSG